LGAFGTHGLKDRLAPDMLEVWRTGVQYHLIHALAAVIAGVLLRSTGTKLVRVAGWLFIAGTVLFSGSLYALAVSGVRILGAITPFGGVCYLAGWVCLAVGASQGKA
jgi:uncharacterized membrane protein YgdD (TMEM256/DUF423 family)